MAKSRSSSNAPSNTPGTPDMSEKEKVLFQDLNEKEIIASVALDVEEEDEESIEKDELLDKKSIDNLAPTPIESNRGQVVSLSVRYFTTRKGGL